MASDDDDSEDLTGGSIEARECMACRGTGRVISNLGGTSSTIECPWCGGTGVRSPEIDAQARWPANEAPAPPEDKSKQDEGAPAEESTEAASPAG